MTDILKPRDVQRARSNCYKPQRDILLSNLDGPILVGPLFIGGESSTKILITSGIRTRRNLILVFHLRTML